MWIERVELDVVSIWGRGNFFFFVKVKVGLDWSGVRFFY